jgi:hypothetical protein
LHGHGAFGWLALLLGRIGETRESAFACKQGGDVEEALTPLERAISLDLSEGFGSVRPSIAATTRNLGQLVCRVLDVDRRQPGAGKQPFVLAGGYEEEIADRSSDGDLLAIECARKCLVSPLFLVLAFRSERLAGKASFGVVVSNYSP